MEFRERVVQSFKKIQDEICKALEIADGKAVFREDIWQHETNGGGRTRVISHGKVFEKGGVNFSAVGGKMPGFMKDRVHADANEFFATGVSIVIHPLSPMIPIIHMNIRYFETDKGDSWFGGGIDLTPIYIVDEQAKKFHLSLKETCDKFDEQYYSKFKTWADDYFFIKHRAETRGIGGVFFDHLVPDSAHGIDSLLEFVAAIGNTFTEAYLPIVNANRSLPFDTNQKTWQLLRRGRYVEFNLVYDRGTRFGLETGGRIESILMSLPEHASWVYSFQPEKGSEEERTLGLLRKGIDWVA